MSTHFEDAFVELVRSTMGELIRQQVAEHVEMLRGPSWVTKKHAAVLLGCSARTVARHISLGRLATSKPPQSPMLVERSSIEELIEASRLPRLEWRHSWLRQPRDLNPLKSPAHVTASKLGHERRRQRELGIHDEITAKVLANQEAKKQTSKRDRDSGRALVRRM